MVKINEIRSHKSDAAKSTRDILPWSIGDFSCTKFASRLHLRAPSKMSTHLVAVLQALFVVFLWATSWVLIKIGLQTISPLTFAGLRYVLAFAILLAVLLFSEAKKEVRMLPRRYWMRLILLGLLFYAGTQGASFVALAFLPAVMVNLLWSFSSVTVALLGMVWLSERQKLLQWGGIGLAIIGASIYFYPVAVPESQVIGIIVAFIGILANSISSILGRGINRSGEYHPMVVTVVSMGAGSIILLVVGLNVEGIPKIDLMGWAIILWLAIVNTAFAFTLWNHTLRTLTAMESSIINGTMLIWIPIFAIIFLGENISGKQVIGLVAVGMGTLLVQLRRIAKVKRDAP
jgi:drug/metabolite transporter (DMT)-like permease